MGAGTGYVEGGVATAWCGGERERRVRGERRTRVCVIGRACLSVAGSEEGEEEENDDDGGRHGREEDRIMDGRDLF